MDVNCYPHCAFCKAQKELEERIKQRENGFEEQLRRMKKIQVAEMLIKEQGAIYRENIERFSIDEINKITNFDFLERMSSKVFLPAQPITN